MVGCIPGLGRLVTMVFIGLGRLLATILIRGFGFLLGCIVGPTFLGLAGEFVLRAVGVRRNGRAVRSGWEIDNRAAYAALSGLAWLLVYALLRLAGRMLSWVGAALSARLASGPMPWLPTALVIIVVFGVGTIVGLVVHPGSRGHF